MPPKSTNIARARYPAKPSVESVTDDQDTSSRPARSSRRSDTHVSRKANGSTTNSNKAIVRIIGSSPHAGQGLRRLIADGALCWSGSKPQLKAPLGVVARGTPVGQIVEEDRV